MPQESLVMKTIEPGILFQAVFSVRRTFTFYSSLLLIELDEFPFDMGPLIYCVTAPSQEVTRVYVQIVLYMSVIYRIVTKLWVNPAGPLFVPTQSIALKLYWLSRIHHNIT